MPVMGRDSWANQLIKKNFEHHLNTNTFPPHSNAPCCVIGWGLMVSSGRFWWTWSQEDITVEIHKVVFSSIWEYFWKRKYVGFNHVGWIAFHADYPKRIIFNIPENYSNCGTFSSWKCNHDISEFIKDLIFFHCKCYDKLFLYQRGITCLEILLPRNLFQRKC